MSEAEEYEVETIVSKRLRKGKLILRVVPYIMRLLSGKAEYLVKWKGWEDPDDNSWLPVARLDCKVAYKYNLDYFFKIFISGSD